MLLNGAKKALGEYQKGKNASGLIDFNDMVMLSEELMKEDLYISEMKSQYDCLIIDEFQDTNPLQFALLWSFYKAGIPTLIVGDIKQSIMGFQ
jgi:ATP-dependent exoDNAse (exonuclease V) beta subunit